MNDPGWYLIAYDVREPRRLRRIHRRLRREGVAMQESVFLVQRTERDIATLMNELAGIIDRHQDDLRAYPIRDPGESWLRGQGLLDGGLLAASTRPGTERTSPAAGSWWRRLIGRPGTDRAP